MSRARAAWPSRATTAFRPRSCRTAISPRAKPSRTRYPPKLVACAGFMRIVTAGFAARYAGRMLNVHPSLLPAFTGLHTHERALAAGVKLHGCSVHFVTPELDAGPIVMQAAVPVLRGDTADTLAARVLLQEHVIYPRAVRWFLDGRLVIENGRVNVKGGDAQYLLSDRT